MGSRSASQLLRVFVASPNDVDAEREVVSNAAAELNRGLGEVLGIRIEIISWETHTYPQIGSDPQAVVNEQIGENYDVFIGILWARFGSPTPRFGSGTLEEFERAKQRFETDPSSVSVMFYFKEEPLSPNDIDPDQLSKVKEFRENLSKNALIGKFSTEEEFGTNIRVHLTRCILKWSALSQMGKTENAEEKPPHETGSGSASEQTTGAERIQRESNNEDEGFLDLVLEADRKLKEATETILRIAGAIEQISSLMSDTTTELNTVDVTKGGSEVKRAKLIVNNFASGIDKVFGQIEVEIPIFRQLYSGAVKNFEKLALLLGEFQDADDSVLNPGLVGLRDIVRNIPSALEGVGVLRKSIEQLPPVTTRFNRAKRRGQRALSSIEREFSAADTLTREVIRLLESRHQAR